MTPALAMSETEEERERRAKHIAYTQGRRDADVDSHLRSHESRLNAINGSIERHARNAQALKDSITELGEKVDRLAAAWHTKTAVEADRVKQIASANKKQISNRTFWLGVATICAMILLGLYAKSGGIG